MLQISLPAVVLSRLAAHAVATYPEECCGLLVGELLPSGEHSVRRSVPAPNVADERRRRYAIDPAVLLAAHREARRDRRRIVGYYHSHPDRPAVPSAFDLEHAWPESSYLIFALTRGRPAEARSYRLVEGRFREETLIEKHGSEE